MCQPNLSVGTLFEEVDDTGALQHHWILCIHPLHPSTIDPSTHAIVDGSLADTALSTNTTKRVSWRVLSSSE